MIMQRAALRHVLSALRSVSVALGGVGCTGSRVDVACDVGGYSLSQGSRLFDTLRSSTLGFPPYRNYPYPQPPSRPAGRWAWAFRA